MKKISIIQDEELVYVANIEDTKIKLRYSKSDIWNESAKGMHRGTLKDTGNHIKIKMENVNLKLDPSEFVDLFILMQLKINSDEQLTDEIIYLTNDE